MNYKFNILFRINPTYTFESIQHTLSNQPNMSNSNPNQRWSTTLQPYMYTLFPNDLLRFDDLLSHDPGPRHELEERFGVVARLMIFSLQYFCCDLENIFQALKSYGFNYTKNPISRYIEIKNFIKHHDEEWHPANGEVQHKTAQFPSAASVTIFYKDGLPDEMTIQCMDLEQNCVTTDLTISTVDARQIHMCIATGKISCHIVSGT